MARAALISPLALLLAGAVSGCESTSPQTVDFKPVYQGVETRFLGDDLVNFQVRMVGARDREDVSRYAECAAAQYTLIRGYGFARHLRTNVDLAGGIWRGDAVYTISPALPRGLKTIDAEVVAADCAENGIPMV
ncbi:hypothetical protein [Roseovarius sp.]|jgi:hypothetical protein